MNLFIRIIILLILFLCASIIVNSQVPTAAFLNDSSTYNGPSNNTLAFNGNITLGTNPVHTMELQSGIGSFEGFGNVDAEIEYRAGNTTGFLLRFVVNDEDGIANDKIQAADCVNSTPSSTICTGSACGGKDFNTFSNITVVFNSTTNNATIHIGTANLSVNVCTNATMIQSVRFMSNFLGIQGYSVKNNVVTADNITSSIAASSSSTVASSSPLGSGSGGYICRLDWQCSEWADCDSGMQTRKCKLVEVPDTVILPDCPQLTVPQQARNCTVPADANTAKGTCMDEIKNQNEENIDCGGACLPCQNNTAIDNTSAQNIQSGPISSRKIVKNYGINIWLFLFIAVLGLAIIILSYKIIKKKNSKK